MIHKDYIKEFKEDGDLIEITNNKNEDTKAGTDKMGFKLVIGEEIKVENSNKENEKWSNKYSN